VAERFEAVSARLQHRPSRDLLHSAVEVVTPEARFVIEMTPIPAHDQPDRGVVAEPSAAAGCDRSACSATRSAGVATASLPIWPRRPGAPCRCRPTPRSPNGSSTSPGRYPRPCGDAANCGWARCGTPIRSVPGSCLAAASPLKTFDRRTMARPRLGRGPSGRPMGQVAVAHRREVGPMNVVRWWPKRSPSASSPRRSPPVGPSPTTTTGRRPEG
jgi:hypothetical protein